MKHSNTSPTEAQVETIDRAKKIDSDGYAIGSLLKLYDMKNAFNSHQYMIINESGFREVIDPSTRAIHFTNSNMNDSEGTPIFASLSSDGNGGDYIEWFPLAYGLKDQKQTDVVGMFQRKIVPLIIRALVFDFSKTKVTGIHTVKEEQ